MTAGGVTRSLSEAPDEPAVRSVDLEIDSGLDRQLEPACGAAANRIGNCGRESELQWMVRIEIRRLANREGTVGGAHADSPILRIPSDDLQCARPRARA